MLRCNPARNVIESACGQLVDVVLRCADDERCLEGSARCVSISAEMDLAVMSDAAVDMDPLTEDMDPLTEDMGPLPEDLGPTSEDMEPLPVDMEPLPEDMEPLPEDMEPLPEDMEPLPVDMDPLPVDMEPMDGGVEESFTVTVSHSSGNLNRLGPNQGVSDVQIALGPTSAFLGTCQELMYQAQLDDALSIRLAEGVVIQVSDIVSQPSQTLSISSAPDMTAFVIARDEQLRVLHAGCVSTPHTPMTSTDTTEIAVTLRPLVPLHEGEYQVIMGLRLTQVAPRLIDPEYASALVYLDELVDTPRSLDQLFQALLCSDPVDNGCATYMAIEPNIKSVALQSLQSNGIFMGALASLGRAVRFMSAMRLTGTLTRSQAQLESPLSDVLIEDFSLNWTRSIYEDTRQFVYSAPTAGQLSLQWSMFADDNSDISLQLSALNLDYSALLTSYAEQIGGVTLPVDAELNSSLCLSFEGLTFSTGLCSGEMAPALEDFIDELTTRIELESSDLSFVELPVTAANAPNRRFESWTATDLGVNLSDNGQRVALCLSVCKETSSDSCADPCF